MLTGDCLCGACRWEMDAPPARATACNCRACTRMGTIWAYGHENVDIRLSGPFKSYTRNDVEAGLAFLFCETCGTSLSWRGLAPNDDGKTPIAVNLRMADAEAVSAIPLRSFDGKDSWSGIENGDKCVADVLGLTSC